MYSPSLQEIFKNIDKGNCQRQSWWDSFDLFNHLSILVDNPKVSNIQAYTLRDYSSQWQNSPQNSTSPRNDMIDILNENDSRHSNQLYYKLLPKDSQQSSSFQSQNCSSLAPIVQSAKDLKQQPSFQKTQIIGIDLNKNQNSYQDKTEQKLSINQQNWMISQAKNQYRKLYDQFSQKKPEEMGYLSSKRRKKGEKEQMREANNFFQNIKRIIVRYLKYLQNTNPHIKGLLQDVQKNFFTKKYLQEIIQNDNYQDVWRPILTTDYMFQQLERSRIKDKNQKNYKELIQVVYWLYYTRKQKFKFKSLGLIFSLNDQNNA